MLPVMRSSRSSKSASHRQFPMVIETIDILELLYTVIDVPVVRVEQVLFPVVAQRQVPWSKLLV